MRHGRREHVLTGGHVEERHLALAEVIGQRRDDGAAQLALDVGDRVGLARPRHLEEERARVGDPERVDAVRAEPHRPELAVADGERIRGAPRLIEAQPRREEVDLALERRLEHLRPVAEVGQDRQVLGADGVLARAEEVGHVALVDEERHLRLADDELATLLDLEVRRGKAPGQHVVAGLGPLQDVDELLLDEIHHTHCVLRVVISGAGSNGYARACPQ